MTDIEFKGLSPPDCFKEMKDLRRVHRQALLDSIPDLAIPEHLLRGAPRGLSGRHHNRPTVPPADYSDTGDENEG